MTEEEWAVVCRTLGIERNEMFEYLWALQSLYGKFDFLVRKIIELGQAHAGSAAMAMDHDSRRGNPAAHN